jgi:hypothetical protein
LAWAVCDVAAVSPGRAIWLSGWDAVAFACGCAVIAAVAGEAAAAAGDDEISAPTTIAAAVGAGIAAVAGGEFPPAVAPSAL